MFHGTDILYLQAHIATLVDVLLYCIYDVKGLLRLDIAGLRTLSEGYAVHHIVALAVHKLQLDVLLVSSHHLAGAIVIHALGAEHGLGIL